MAEIIAIMCDAVILITCLVACMLFDFERLKFRSISEHQVKKKRLSKEYEKF